MQSPGPSKALGGDRGKHSAGNSAWNTDKSRAFSASIVSNGPVGREHWLISLKPGNPTQTPRPGQFYMISAGPFPEPLLKRPFCHFGGDGTITLLYRLRGKGTRLLSGMRPGDGIDVLGPLGNAWPEPPEGKTPVVIAGGTGIASVFPLIISLGRKAIVIYGARCGEDVLYKDELLSMSAELHLATDDGTCGIKGTVSDVLRGFFTLDPSHYLYVCGPEIMTRAVAEEARSRGVEGVASLEAYMACGIGACMGCVVLTTSGYKRVCKEGPVFNLMELVFD